MAFIKIEKDRIINFNNVTAICKVNEKLIRIYFIDDFMDFRRESEEELNILWEWLEEVCINGRDI